MNDIIAFLLLLVFLAWAICSIPFFVVLLALEKFEKWLRR